MSIRQAERAVDGAGPAGLLLIAWLTAFAALFEAGTVHAAEKGADKAAGKVEEQCVVLLHGLARGSGSFWLIQKVLSGRGYFVVNPDYPSTSAPIAMLASHVGKAVERCGARQVNFVTHSMGGIILRFWLSEHTLDRLGRVVMLGPPNHGSEIVDIFGDMPPFEWLNGPAGLELGTDAASVLMRLPSPHFSLGIIAGDVSLNPVFDAILDGPNDGKVTVASTRLEGAQEHLVVHATHTFMMFNPVVVMETVSFLERGSFNRTLDFTQALELIVKSFP